MTEDMGRVKIITELCAELALHYYYRDNTQWRYAVKYAADRSVRYVTGEMGDPEARGVIPRHLRKRFVREPS